MAVKYFSNIASALGVSCAKVPNVIKENTVTNKFFIVFEF
jgi:hypothetical protein